MSETVTDAAPPGGAAQPIEPAQPVTAAAARAPWRAAAARVAPALVPLAVLIATGLAGIDFGLHWDEQASQIEPARTMLVRGDLLPNVYVYPGMARWLCLLPALVYALPHAFDVGLRQAMLDAIAAPDYLFSVRGVFIVITGFGVLWVYLAILATRKSVLEAVLGASALAFSWEYAYHDRWVTTDCVMATFAAFTLMCAAQYREAPQQRAWLWAAAVSTGLTFGTKYPGLIMLVAVSVAAWQGLKAASGGRTIARVLGTYSLIGALVVVTFLATTPGTLLDAAKFKEDMIFQLGVYKTGWGAYTIEPGWEHLKHAFEYFAFTYFSHFKPVAVALFVAALAGAATLLRRRAWADAAFLLPVPILYFLYFATQKVMIVRNLQIVGVFAVVLAARGLAAGLSWARERQLAPQAAKAWRPLVIGAAAATVLMLTANAAWLVTAAQSIRTRTTAQFGPPAVEWMKRHPELKFSLSPNLGSALVGSGLTLPPNVVADRAQATHIGQFGKLDHWLGGGWIANDPWMTYAVFGPFEVNFDYYPTWYGDDRIVFVTVADATRLQLGLP